MIHFWRSTMTNVPLVRDYADSTALIAGGTSGIGLACALALASAGVRRIALLGRNADRGLAAQAQVSEAYPEAEVSFLRVDATDPNEVRTAVNATVDRFGSLDVAVSSVAPDVLPELLFRMPSSNLTDTISALANPPVLLTHAALTVMREQGGGCIINIASDAGKTATPGESAIGAAMAAIIMFSRVAAIEGKRDAVRVNVLTPSLVLGTPTAENVMRSGFSKKLFERAAAQASLGVAMPHDIAALVTFLAGPAAAKLTGQAISLNGGISAA
jgi:NAD(P)-dependent dehydrogenase (short-subunit alcohol dehydrogenase family)